MTYDPPSAPPASYAQLYCQAGLEDPRIKLDQAMADFLAGKITRDEYRAILGLPPWPENGEGS